MVRESVEVFPQSPPYWTTSYPSATPHQSSFLVHSPASLHFSEYIPATQYASFNRKPKTEYCIQVVALPELITGGESLLQFCWPLYFWFWLARLLLAFLVTCTHCWLMSTQDSKNLSFNLSCFKNVVSVSLSR